jgi:hypothetical protein
MLLAGCATPDPQVLRVVEIVVPEAPAELLGCQAAPAVPAEPLDGQDVARFILQLDAAGDDCRRTLADLAAWLEDAGRRFAP